MIGPLRITDDIHRHNVRVNGRTIGHITRYTDGWRCYVHIEGWKVLESCGTGPFPSPEAAAMSLIEYVKTAA